MSNEATDKQVVPHGQGRDITTLIKEDILTENFLVPEEGLKTLELWARSAALYLKMRLNPGLEQFGQTPIAKTEVAHAMIRDFEDRAKMGEKKYGERLKAFNGRNALIDALQEAYDQWIYLRQNREEKEV